MEKQEAINIKEKIDSVLNAAIEFAEGTKKLNSAKKQLEKYIEAAEVSNNGLVNVVQKTEDVLDAAKCMQDLISEEIKTKVDPKLEEFAGLIVTCRDEYEKITRDYAEGLENLTKAKDVYAAQQRDTEKYIEDMVSDIAANTGDLNITLSNLQMEINRYNETQSRTAQNIVDKLIESVGEKVGGLDAYIKSTVKTRGEEIGNIDDAVSKIAKDIAVLENSIEEGSKLSTKNAEHIVNEVRNSERNISKDVNNASGAITAIQTLLSDYIRESRATQQTLVSMINETNKRLDEVSRNLYDIKKEHEEFKKDLEIIKAKKTSLF